MELCLFGWKYRCPKENLRNTFSTRNVDFFKKYTGKVCRFLTQTFHLAPNGRTYQGVYSEQSAESSGLSDPDVLWVKRVARAWCHGGVTNHALLSELVSWNCQRCHVSTGAANSLSVLFTVISCLPSFGSLGYLKQYRTFLDPKSGPN